MSGQINRGSLAGDFIYALAGNLENKVFVDIGTWNGQGSTKCIMDALIDRTDKCVLYSLEAEKKFYDSARQYWEDRLFMYSSVVKDRLKLIHGRIVEADEMPPIEKLRESRHWIDDMLRWYQCDMSNYNSCPNVLDLIPESIDVLILDGGEFMTQVEFRKLKGRARIVVCDDSSIYKCEAIREELLDDTSYSTLIDRPDLRNGFCVFEKS